jgi:predicted ATPase
VRGSPTALARYSRERGFGQRLRLGNLSVRCLTAGECNGDVPHRRIGLSLARLRRQQGRREEAAALLAPILGWFTEGFDTADIKEARTLLDKLTEPAIAAEG